MKISTRCVCFDQPNDPHGAMVPPIYQTATFEQSSASEFGEYDYTRSGNPTRALLEQQLANLEADLSRCRNEIEKIAGSEQTGRTRVDQSESELAAERHALDKIDVEIADIRHSRQRQRPLPEEC